MKKVIKIGIIIALSLISASTFATQLNATTQASAKLASSCTVSSTDISFGLLGTQSNTFQEGTGTLNVLCSKSASYTIAIALGSNGVSGYRYMVGATTGNTDKITYAVCQKEGFVGTSCTGTLWYTGSYVLHATGTGINQTYTMYGYAKEGFYTPDNYSDHYVLS